MSRLKSEILFNRALLWFALACMAMQTGSKVAAGAYTFACLFNLFKSMEAWGEDE